MFIRCFVSRICSTHLFHAFVPRIFFTHLFHDSRSEAVHTLATADRFFVAREQAERAAEAAAAETAGVGGMLSLAEERRADIQKELDAMGGELRRAWEEQVRLISVHA